MARDTMFSKLFRGWRQRTKDATPLIISNRLKQRGYTYAVTTIEHFESGDERPDGQFIAAMEVLYRIDKFEITGWLEAVWIDFLDELAESYEATSKVIGG